MKRLKAKVINCKNLGIRRDPSITPICDEVIETIDQGAIVELPDSSPIIEYSWDDRKFYKVITTSGKEGYANVKCLEIIGGTDGEQ